MACNLTTKSIDVGSMFLMDLSVNESELEDSELQRDELELLNNLTIQDGDMVFPINIGTLNYNERQQVSAKQKSNRQQQSEFKQSNNSTNQSSITQSFDSFKKHHLSKNRLLDDDLLENSLGRLATVINENSNELDALSANNHDQTHQITVVGQEIHPFAHHHLSRRQKLGQSSLSLSSSSLSDESFVASSGDGIDSFSSYSGSSQGDFDEQERASTTTREDSGIIDIKGLGCQKLDNSYDGDEDEIESNHANDNYQMNYRTQISTNITATNLINNSVKSQQRKQKQKSNRPTKNNNQHPTDDCKETGSSIDDYHQLNHYHHRGSRRSVSASLPIQVPTKQMFKPIIDVAQFHLQYTSCCFT